MENNKETETDKEEEIITLSFTYKGTKNEIVLIKKLISELGEKRFNNLLAAELFTIIDGYNDLLKEQGSSTEI